MSRRWASSEQILPAQRHLRHNGNRVFSHADVWELMYQQHRVKR